MPAVSRIAQRIAALRETARFLWARPAHLAGVLAAGLFGGALGVPVADDTFSYLWRDDRFCNDCHVHDYANEAYDRSAHAGLTTCHDCHSVPLRHYPRNLWVTVFDPPQGPEDIPVPHVEDGLCLACHAVGGDGHTVTGPMPDSLRATVVKIDESALHQSHLAETLPDGQPVTCMSCHGADHNRAHRFRTGTATCLGCHEDTQPEGHDSSPLPCRECHFTDFAGR